MFDSCTIKNIYGIRNISQPNDKVELVPGDKEIQIFFNNLSPTERKEGKVRIFCATSPTGPYGSEYEGWAYRTIDFKTLLEKKLEEKERELETQRKNFWASSPSQQQQEEFLRSAELPLIQIKNIRSQLLVLDN